jgi:predicted P-loop ATPase
VSTGIGKPRIDRDRILAAINLSDVIGQDQQIVRDGREFKSLCPFHEERTPSFYINDEKGFYHCFGCGAHGTAIDWIQFQKGCDFKTACEELGSMREHNVVPIAKAPPIRKRATDYVAIAVPPDVRMPDMEIKGFEGKPALGKPQRSWAYRDRDGNLLGFVGRYIDNSNGKKEIRTWTYGSYPQGERAEDKVVRWRCRRWQRPYPLYGLEKLSEPGADQKRVVIVSGEKCKDAAEKIMPESIVLTWPGGDDGVQHADWEPLAGRGIVILWPDADESGRRAMEWVAAEIGPMITGDLWLINVDDPELPKGWDVADAVEDENRDAAWLREFIKKVMPDGQQRIRKINKPTAVQTGVLVPKTETKVEPVEDQDRPPPQHDPWHWSNQPWRTKLILGGEDKDRVLKCEHNTAVPFRHMDELKGAFRFNSVRGVIEIAREMPWGDKPGEFRDSNLVRMCQWFNRMGFHMGKEMMGDAVDCVAQEWSYNPIANYLGSLNWDGTKRLDTWLSAYAGADDNLYTREIGKRWMVSAVARGMKPGTQVDTMLVLEGIEGIYKTSLLRVLGGELFTPLRGTIGASDGRAATCAATNWIIEFGELEGINRTDWETLKDFLSTTEEMMRLAYRRNAERLFRTSVFAGTVNTDKDGRKEWLPPDGDHRRFWPILTRYCDIAALRRDRDQLWAEAREKYEGGQHWWIKPEESELVMAVKTERETRKFHDEWNGIVMNWCCAPMRNHEDAFTLREITSGALFIETSKLDKATQMRVGKIMSANGWSRDVQRRESGLARVWRRPGSTSDLLK